ncbi:MAG TPA: exosortase-associated EpsI family protein [Isosphaeraceae bacterium]|jgi:hypothetical protein|nr:exosortase-associated EpsI family protein [Isosphaeraceae bacterium]
MTRILSYTAAIGLLVASGILHESWTHQWRGAPKVTMATARLDRVATSLGDWHSQPTDIEQRDLVGLGIDATLARRYVNERTGRAVTMLLMCGKPGPVSVHTPDVCYLDAGYLMAQPLPGRVTVSPPDHSPQAALFSADFYKQDSLDPKRLRIYWSWSAGKDWIASDHPRITFASATMLYKLYLIADVTAGRDEIAEEFARELLPHLDRVLFSNRKS